ncbi:MAG: SpoIIE family protein phosphatase [Coriobacteriales bacterium]|nr:SpoIIE family protein phosphatase [Coriobacteriales bacterium]
MVAVGASAGGLESFTQLLGVLPERLGMALVLIQHLDPTHETALAEILQRASKMPVVEATDGMLVEPDHVYVMPPNVVMELAEGALRLSPRAGDASEALPIDRFFVSLADHCGSSSVGIVLSGTGADGAKGLAAIKESGGLAFAQDRQYADNAGMLLQTAQEELHPTTEELTTLDHESRNRETELSHLADDLDNVIRGVEIPILILGPDLRIRRLTPQADTILNVVPADVGKPVTDLNLKVDVPDFRGAIERVLRTHEPSQTEVQDADGHWFSMRIRPYRTGADSYEGVVIAFIDIDPLKRTTRVAESALAHAQAVVETVREPLLTLTPAMHVQEANRAFYDAFGVSPDETIGVSIYALGNGQWDIPELRSLLEGILPGDREFADLEVDHVFPGIGHRIVVLGARRVQEESGVPSILLAIDDVTAFKMQERISAALNDISAMVGSAFDFDATLDDVLAASVNAICADSGAVLLKQPEDWLVKSAYGPHQPQAGSKVEADRVPASGLAIESKDIAAVPDISADERFAGGASAALGHGRVLAAPLLLRDEIIGSVTFERGIEGDAFGESEVDFARRLATILSLAFENARLYSTQRTIADTLQTALLTVPRRIPGIEFGYLYRSATAAASVGGDLYDLFETGEHRVGMLIGDVSGKGVEAATLAGLVKNTIRALAFGNESPADVMARTNEVVLRATTQSTFVTLLFCILDTRTGKLVYCSAGHTRGILRRRDGGVELLAVGSPITGAFEHARYVNGETSFAPGDVMVLYTDGVTEARQGKELLGEERLVGLVRGLPGVSTPGLPQAILDEVMAFAGGTLSDDVAIITIEFEGEGSVARRTGGVAT